MHILYNILVNVSSVLRNLFSIGNANSDGRVRETKRAGSGRKMFQRCNSSATHTIMQEIEYNV